MVSSPRASSGLVKVRPSSHFWKSPVANLPSWPALLGLLLIFSMTVVLTTTAMHHDGMYSPLNRSPRRQYQALHNQYLESATSFFSAFHGSPGLDSNSSHESNRSRPASFDIGRDVSGLSTAVVAMASKRRVPYVQIWAWSLVTGSSAQELNRTSVTIVNTQRPSSANSEDVQPLRDAGFRVVDMYGSDVPENEKQWSDWILDEYLCHIAALRECDRAGVVWCIVFEEDSLMTRDLLGKFRTHVVEGLESRRADVGMVKLFTSDAWSGYEWPSWPYDLLLVPGCLAALLTAPLCYFLAWISSTVCEKRRRNNNNVSVLPSSTSPPPKRRWSFFKLAVVYATLFGSIVAAAEVMSRQSVIAMLDFPGLHIDPCTKAMSTVAVAFPIEITRKLREHLEGIVASGGKARSVPIDLEVFAWAGNLGLAVLQTTPSLAQHVGLFSSNPLKGNALYLNQDSRFTFLAQENALPRALSRIVPTW